MALYDRTCRVSVGYQDAEHERQIVQLSASIVLERARAGRPSMRGISRLRPVRGATDGDLDIDASIEAVSAARMQARPVTPEDLTTVQWAKAHTAFAVVVDRSGSMSGARLAAAATVAAACALRAPQEHAVLSFAGSVEVIRPLVSDIAPAYREESSGPSRPAACGARRPARWAGRA